MRIASIETSCDETAVSIVETEGDFPHATYTVLGDALFSQIDIHREYGGVFPNVAKREHAKTLVPMLKKALEESGSLREEEQDLPQNLSESLHEILYREEGLTESLSLFLEHYKRPPIDILAVTSGPGLEPTLWVGINFARALATAWNIPVVAVNHMEGHILSSIFNGTHIADITFPAIVLLISGGHTELISMNDWCRYEVIGQTRGDAVGEAFDKVARMLDLPYPGGPEISKIAEEARAHNIPPFAGLPRPMLDSGDHDFSFSGLKTAVRYAIDDKKLDKDERAAVARGFEDAVTEVLLTKTQNAIDQNDGQTLIIGGGVSANRHLRETFTKFFEKEYPTLRLFIPKTELTTDNSIMIALAGHAHSNDAIDPKKVGEIKADGNLSLS